MSGPCASGWISTRATVGVMPMTTLSIIVRAGVDRLLLGKRDLLQRARRARQQPLAEFGQQHAAAVAVEQRTPRSRSRLRTCRLSADWLMPSEIAAREKLPNSATLQKYSRCCEFMAVSVL